MIMIMYVCVPESPTWCIKCGTAVWVAFTRNRLSAAFACFLSRLGNVCLAYPKESNCKSTHSHFSNCRLYSGKTLWKELFTAVPVEDGITLKLGCITVSAEDVSMVGLNVILRVNVVTILIYIEPFWALTLRVGHEGVFLDFWSERSQIPLVFIKKIMDVSMAHLWKSCPVQSHFKMIRKMLPIVATYCRCQFACIDRICLKPVAKTGWFTRA